MAPAAATFLPSGSAGVPPARRVATGVPPADGTSALPGPAFRFRPITIKACLQNRFAVSAPEARKQVAHGETVGLAVKTNQAPAAAAENRRQNVSFAPFRSLDGLRLEAHGFTVGYYRSLLRSYKWILKTRPRKCRS